MPLPSLILMVAGMTSMFLAMGSAYLAAPKLKAWLKRQTPSVDVPAFDFGDQRGTDRLISLLWTVEIPSDRPRLRRLVLAHRGFLIAGPLLMFAGGMLMTSTGDAVVRPEPGSPPSVMITISEALPPPR
jgi:hypothetical protein